MKKLSLVLAAVVAASTLSVPVFAASRQKATTAYDNVNTVRTYGDRDYNNPPFGHSARGAYARGSTEELNRFRGPAAGAAGTYGVYNYGQNLPYPDRPYGDPDSW